MYIKSRPLHQTSKKKQIDGCNGARIASTLKCCNWRKV